MTKREKLVEACDDACRAWVYVDKAWVDADKALANAYKARVDADEAYADARKALCTYDLEHPKEAKK